MTRAIGSSTRSSRASSRRRAPSKAWYAVLRRGRSSIFELENATQHKHPIHIHGHSFTVIASNRRDLPVHHADTVLLGPRERVEAALVAGEPGDWMFHCHIIEHQESGMMGYVRVT